MESDEVTIAAEATPSPSPSPANSPTPAHRRAADTFAKAERIDFDGIVNRASKFRFRRTITAGWPQTKDTSFIQLATVL